MGVIFTRKQIRTRVQNITRDGSDTIWSEAIKNRAIDSIQRDYLNRTTCDRNVLIFSLADASSDGVIEYDRNADAPDRDTPTVTRVDVENQNHYTVSNIVRLNYLGRWIGQEADDDGFFKELRRVNQQMIDERGLLSFSLDPPRSYQLLSAPDTFRFVPALESDGFPYKFELRYREAVQDLITNDDAPTDNSTVFSGGGDDDATVAGTGTDGDVIVVTIDAEGTPDTFKWSLNGAEQAAGVSVAVTATILGTTGRTILWADTDNHAVNDSWTFYSDDIRTPSCPQRFREAIVWGAIATLWEDEGDSRGAKYRQLYERAIVETKIEVNRDADDRPTETRRSYKGAGS